MTLHELQRRLKPFEIRQEVVNVIRETTPKIRELNQEQLFLGLLATGKEIKNLFTKSFFYSPSWARERGRRGLQTDHFDLRVTGAFWNSIYTRYIGYEKFNVESKDSKATSLYEMFGLEILGLTRDSRGEYVRETFEPALRKHIKQKLGV